MASPEVSRDPVDPVQLSDPELIRLYCANRKEQPLAAEIWRRYGNVIRESLKRLVFQRHSLCPDSVDRKTFLDSTFSRAYLKCLGGICGLRTPDSPQILKAWLNKVAKRAALDEYRALTRIRSKIIEVGFDEVFPDGDAAVPVDTPAGEKRKFRTKLMSFYERAQKIPPPDAGIKAEERKLLMREALLHYAQTSEEAADSARVIRLWCWKGWSMARIGAIVFGDPLTDVEEKRKEKAIERELKQDAKNLRRVLMTDFGITSPAQV